MDTLRMPCPAQHGCSQMCCCGLCNVILSQPNLKRLLRLQGTTDKNLLSGWRILIEPKQLSDVKQSNTPMIVTLVRYTYWDYATYA